ncbi:peptidyl-prolyl cis-trans isomerase A [Geobacter sp. OR-1]|uniref:peptidylprolyl isomerase n=1 Tax=Geobacter sp. OR-1 TaxID=1266765 RepID=UPI00054350AD|nr:peptidylprolyl isomerase [Geobacter sp. OR-1]GAM08547.1 peptidyl-prolyl cis-trans isomerase A [Geobacter sp. OR-1]
MFKKLFGAIALCLLAATCCFAAEKNPVVLMETSLGNVKIELFQKEAPISVKNFIEYANSGYYAGTVFHRIIPGFMAQGGGLTAELQPKPGARPAIKNEADNGLKNDRGTIAMARTSDPNSATSQFFINVVNNNSLNRPSFDGYGYAVFGKVIDGMDVADKIVSAPQERKNAVFQNVPKTPILIKSVKVLK